MASGGRAKSGKPVSISQKLAAIPPMPDAERACNIGDLLEVIARLDLIGTMEAPTLSVVEPSGQI